MSMALYCKNQGLTLDEYRQFKANIEATAEAIVQLIKSNYHIDDGMYHPTAEILPIIPGKTDIEVRAFIIQALKTLGVEFIENNALWRY